jgi:hypothetical protein
MPALNARNSSLTQLQNLLGVGGDSSAANYGALGIGGSGITGLTNEPGYQFGLTQGQTALQNQLTARGMRNSGAAAMAAARYGNDYATTKYDAAVNRILNPLQSLAGLGQSGANTIAQAGGNYANTVGNNLTSLGNAQGAAAIAQGNTWGNALNQIGGIYQNYQNKQNGQYNPGNTFNVDSNGGYTYKDSSAVGPF